MYARISANRDTGSSRVVEIDGVAVQSRVDGDYLCVDEVGSTASGTDRSVKIV